MFCPKCGRELPDTAEFCGSCGVELKGRKPKEELPAVPEEIKNGAAVALDSCMSDAATPDDSTSDAVAPHAPGADASASSVATSKRSFPPTKIGALIVTILVAVMMMLPWISSPAMKSLSKVASTTYNYVTGSSTSSRSYDYPMYNMGELVSTFNNVESLGNSLSSSSSSKSYKSNPYSSSSNSKASSLKGTMGRVHAAYLVFWIISLGLTVIGAIVWMVKRKNHKVLLAGLILTAVVSLAWIIGVTVLNNALTSALNSYLGSSIVALQITAAPVIALIGAIVGAILVGRPASHE